MSAGRLRVQVPSGPPISSERSSVFRAPGLGPGGRRWKSCRSDHFQIAAVVEYIRHPSSKRNDAGGSPAGSANFKLPGSVKVARRPVKPFGVGASPTLAANFQGVMSAADGLVRNEEVAGATPATLTISGRQADISWLHLSRKQDRHRRGRSITDAFRQFFVKRETGSHITLRT